MPDSMRLAVPPRWLWLQGSHYNGSVEVRLKLWCRRKTMTKMEGGWYWARVA